MNTPSLKAFDIARTQTSETLSGFEPIPTFELSGGNSAELTKIEFQNKTWYVAHLTITSNGLKLPATLRFNNFMTADDFTQKSNGFFNPKDVNAIYVWCQKAIENAEATEERYATRRREPAPA